MALFPSSPTNGQQVTVNGIEYTYNSSQTAWIRTGATISQGDLVVGGNLSVAGNSTLGSNANVKISGGSSGYVLSTDGASNLSWVAQSAGGGASISNGTSNVDIATSGGNVTTSVAGNANVLVVTGTGANVKGTVTATQFVSNIATGTAPFVVNSNTVVANLNAMQVDGYDASTANTANTLAARDASGNIAANFFIGNGSQLTGLPSGTSIANGNSNINIPVANGNVNISSGGNANVLVVRSGGANITGTLDVNGNIIGANIYANSGTIGAGNLAGTLTAAYNAQPNITTVGTLTSLNVNSTVTAVGFTANTGVFTGNANGLTGIPGANVTGTVPSATSATTAGTVTTASQPNITSVGTLTGLNVNGTITAVDITANTGVFTGNGSGLSNLAGANVTGTVANANYSANAGNAAFAIHVVDNSQPNITTVGTLTSLTVGGNITPSANITYDLGNNTNRFRDIYLANSTIYLGAQTINANATSVTISGNLVANIVGNISGALANGNSSVAIPSANGNVNITAVGNTTMVVTGTGANITGTANISGNANVGNLGAARVLATANVTAPQFISNATTGTAPFIVNSTTLVANLNAMQVDGYDTSTANTASTIAARDVNGNLAANFFIGNGSQLTGIITSVSNVSNGASNLNIPASSGNVTISVNGVSNVLVVTNSGANIDGTANVTGNLSAGNANISGNVQAANFIGNGAALTGISSIVNGNSNVSVAANSDVTISSAGNANVVTVTGSAANVSGMINVTGNVQAANLRANNEVYTNILSLNTGGVILPADTGDLVWDTTSQTVALRLTNGELLYLGQENNYLIKANTNLTKGQVVAFVGVSANVPLVDPANLQSTGFLGEYVIGVVGSDVTAGNTGYATSLGQVGNIDTNSFNVGDILYADPATPGGLINSVPTGANAKVQVGAVVHKGTTDGIILTRTNPFPTISQLSGVSSTTATNNQYLRYNTTGNVWQPANLQISNDPTPNLGGNLNANNHSFTSVNDITANTANFSGAVLTTASISNPLQLATKQYVDQSTSAGIHIHTPVRVEAPGALTTTYTQGGTTPTITTISGGNTLTTSTTHGLAVNDIIVFDTSTNGLTAGIPYVIYSVPASNQITLSLTYGPGLQVTGLTNGTGLSITSRANSGVGATLTNAGTQTALVLGGVTMNVGDRVLIYEQTNAYENGVYTVTNVGSGSTNWVLTRALDQDTYAPQETSGMGAGDYFYVQAGYAAGESYVMTTEGIIILGTTPITYTLFSASIPYTGVSPVVVSGQNISLANLTGTGDYVVLANTPTLITPNIGAATGISLDVSTGNINAGNLNATVANITGNVLAGNVLANTGTINANAYLGNSISVGGNVDGGDFNPSGNLIASGYVSAANLYANSGQVKATTGNFSGNVDASYFIGNGAFLTGISAGSGSSISNGNSNVNIPSANGNVNITAVGNTTLVITGTGANITGTLGVSGNANVGNLGTGVVLASGNVTGQNVIANANLITPGITTSATNGNLTINPNGTGNLVISAATPTVMGNSLTVNGNTKITSNTGSATDSGAVLISADGTYLNINNPGVMLQITGQETNPTRLYIDGVGTSNYPAIIGRHYRGNTASPSAIQNNDVISRYGATPYTSVGWPSISTTRVDMIADENQTGTNQGSRMEFWITPTGSSTIQKELTINAAGVVANGNLTAGNLYANSGQVKATTGNFSGNVDASYFIGNGAFLTGITAGGGASISNGNSNVNIPSANGNVNISVAGNANIAVITGTGANIAGTLNVTGNANVGNIGATVGAFTNVSGEGGNLSNIQGGNVSGAVASATSATNASALLQNTSTATTVYPTFTTSSANGNSSAVINTSISANLGNASITATTFVGTLSGAATTAGTVTTASQPNITSVGTLTSLAVTGNTTSGNFIGALANGNSNVNIPAANGNVNITAVGNTTLVVTGTGANITGTLGVSGNTTGANLIANTNVFTPSITTTATNGNLNIDPNGSGFAVFGTTTPVVISNSTTQTTAGLQLTGDILATNNDFGLMHVGNASLTFNDINLISVMTANANGYAQMILQNQSANNAASADFVVNNDTSSGATVYGDFGINSTTFAASGPFGGANTTYLYSSGGNLGVGTLTTHSMFLATANTTRITIDTGGNTNVAGNLNFSGAKANLGSNANVIITGGTAGQFLSTDGAGNLSWAPGGGAGGASIANGTSNVNIAASGGNITFGVGGNANILNIDTNAVLTANGSTAQLNLSNNEATTTTANNTLSYVVRNMGGRMMPAFAAPDQDGTLQPSIGRNRVFYLAPVGLNTTTVPAAFPGTTVLTSVGTATARAFAATNILTRVPRMAYVGNTIVGNIISSRIASAFLTTGTGTNLGGFTYVFRFGVSDAATVTGARMFVGLSSNTGAPTNVEPSTLLNSLGIAQLSTDATQWYFVYGGSAAQTPIALGTALGAPTATNTVWELILFSPPNQNAHIGYELRNLGTGVQAQGYITPTTPGTQTPASTTALTKSMYRTNNATTAAVAYDFVTWYCEVDQ